MATVISLLVLTMFALIGGGVFLWRRGGARRQAVLMIVLAGVIAANVAILAIPDDSGQSPLRSEPGQ